MKLPKRDVVATLLVAVAGLLYGLWLADAAPLGLDSVRAVGLVVLGLGFAASASAVVPGFERLLHGNKVYLGVTTAAGIVALVAGVQMLLTSSERALAVLVVAMGALWLIATVHHVLLAGAARPRTADAPRHRPRHA